MGTIVLIVDDSKLARIVLAKAINALQPGWERVEAANADEALAILERRRVDVAVLDYNMPGRNGVELAEELRRHYPAIAVAVATANVQEEVIASIRAAGAAFVPKPVTEDSIRGFLSGATLKLRAAAT
jgi:CheY-like chemotaxis protein